MGATGSTLRKTGPICNWKGPGANRGLADERPVRAGKSGPQADMGGPYGTALSTGETQVGSVAKGSVTCTEATGAAAGAAVIAA